MSSRVVLSQGDLIEFNSPRGNSDEGRLRGYVMELRVNFDEDHEKNYTEVIIYGGRRSMELEEVGIESKGDHLVKSASFSPNENNVDRKVISLTFQGLKDLDYQVVRRGNDPTELTNYRLDIDPKKEDPRFRDWGPEHV